LDIIIENENAQLVPFKMNFEEAKTHILQEVEKYRNLVVSEEFMKQARTSRTDLNKMKKELKDKLIALKKKALEPYDAVKKQADELDAIIDEPLKVIDSKIKEHEQKLRDDKEKEIDKLYAELLKKFGLKIDFCRIANPQWLNQTYKINKIEEEISAFFNKVKVDLGIIGEYDEEIRIPMELEYHRTYDMSKVMQLKIAYDKRQKELEDEAKKLLEKVEQEDKMILHYQDPKNVDFGDEPQAPTSDEAVTAQPNTHEQVETPQQVEAVKEAIADKELIRFWCKVTPAQKTMMREFIIANGIECGKIEG